MPVEAVVPGQTKMPSGPSRGGMFRALSNRDFRLFWIGAFLSNVGTWMQAVAQALLVYNLTNSAFWLGLDAFMATAPAFILTLLGGVFADLIDRRRLLIFTQTVAGLTALTLATTVATGVINRWMVLGFTVVTGCCMSLASPSYLAMTYDLVGREDLTNAIAMNSTQFQLSRVLGPALAASGLHLFGIAGCFYLNGVSFAAVVIALSKVRPVHPREPAPHAVSDRRALLRDLLEGFRYVRNRPRVSSLLLLSAVNSLFGAPYLTLVPVYARKIFQLGDSGIALMMGTAGAGAFFGALLVAYLGDSKRKGWFVLGGSIMFGVCVTVFAWSTVLAMSLVFLFALGFAIVISVAITNTLLQKLVTDEMRGRVMSMFILSFVGTMPIGNIIAGAATDHIGPQKTLAIGGAIITAVATLVAIFNQRLRHLY